MSHGQRLVCPSSSGSRSSQVCVLGKFHLLSWTQPCTSGRALQGSTKLVTPCSPPAWPISLSVQGLSQWSWTVAAMWVMCCTLGHTLTQQSRPLGGSEKERGHQ